MKPKSLILLAVAAGCGLVAMVGVQQVLSRENDVERQMGQVLVATSEIVPGVPLDQTNTMFKKMPVWAVPEGAVTKPEDYAERALRLGAVPNEVIMISKLGQRGQFGGSTEIPEGYRVGTVQVNTTKTHSGLILPGDYVDVVVTYKTRINNRMVDKTKTVLEYIQVFATDSVRKSGVSADATEINAKNISLLVTPQQYNMLMLAEKMGEITLALRNRSDDSVVDTDSVDSSIFEDLAAGHGDYNDGEEGESGNVREFLQQQAQEQETEVAAQDEPVEPERPMWTIRIYEGETMREEQVEIPEEMLPQPPAAAAATSDVATAPGNVLKGWLQRFLIGA